MSSKTMPLVPSLWLVLFVLAAVLLLALSGDAFSPFVRTLFALPLMAFLPGYAFLRAFVAADKLTKAQRYTLSVGFSLVLTIFVGFGLDRLPWGLTTQTWAISLGAVVLACLAVEGLRSQHGAKEPPTNA